MKTSLPKVLFLILLLNLGGIQSKAQEPNPLNIFEPLMGGKWLVEGTWENGGKFKQEVVLEWGLDKKIVKVKTYGTIDQATNAYGLRNEGIRAWSLSDSTIQFWEFDVFGGITEGTCQSEGRNIYYDYDYQGLALRDAWNYINDDTYEFVVGSVKDGKMDKVYQKSTFRRVE